MNVFTYEFIAPRDRKSDVLYKESKNEIVKKTVCLKVGLALPVVELGTRFGTLEYQWYQPIGHTGLKLPVKICF